MERLRRRGRAARCLVALFALAAGALVAVAGAASGRVADAIRVPSVKPASVQLPLTVTKASIALQGGRLVGSAVIEDQSSTSVFATEGAYGVAPGWWRRARRLKTFSVPALSPKGSAKVRLGASPPSNAGSGKYIVLVCLDVDSQLQSFRQKTNCAKVGSVTVPARSLHRHQGSPPNTKITAGPSGTVETNDAVFTFSSNQRQCPTSAAWTADPGFHASVRSTTRAWRADRTPLRSGRRTPVG